MKSMTGFGTASKSTKDLVLEARIKSVNGRYLDIKPHMPREYAGLEAEVKAWIRERVSRGSVDIYLSRRSLSPDQPIQVNAPIAQSWVRHYKKLSRETGLPFELSLFQLSQLPEVMLVKENPSLLSREKDEVFAVLEKAFRAWDRERGREGKALKTDLSQGVQELETLQGRMRELQEKAQKEMRSRISKRLKSLGLESEPDPQRLAQEVVFYLDRADINEELSRLDEHLKNYKKLIQAKNSVGKRLDFYCQELLREVNTIGSKANLAALTQVVVEAKAAIEKLREQSQNVE